MPGMPLDGNGPHAVGLFHRRRVRRAGLRPRPFHLSAVMPAGRPDSEMPVLTAHSLTDLRSGCRFFPCARQCPAVRVPAVRPRRSGLRWSCCTRFSATDPFALQVFEDPGLTGKPEPRFARSAVSRLTRIAPSGVVDSDFFRFPPPQSSGKNGIGNQGRQDPGCQAHCQSRRTVRDKPHSHRQRAKSGDDAEYQSQSGPTLPPAGNACSHAHTDAKKKVSDPNPERAVPRHHKHQRQAPPLYPESRAQPSGSARSSGSQPDLCATPRSPWSACLSRRARPIVEPGHAILRRLEGQRLPDHRMEHCYLLEPPQPSAQDVAQQGSQCNGNLIKSGILRNPGGAPGDRWDASYIF